MNVAEYMQTLGQNARQAARAMSRATTEDKNKALLAIAGIIAEQRDRIKAANEQDMEQGRRNGLDAALLDRLELTDDRIDTMIEGLHQVASLADPVGEITDLKYRPSGIQVGKMRVPLGVIGIIYESRPNVTIEAASLCLKSGNAAILRGGSESFESSRVILSCLQEGLRTAGLPETAIQAPPSTDRAAVGEMLAMADFIDVIVPRGGKSLIERVQTESKIPVIAHLEGLCHTYIDGRHLFPLIWYGNLKTSIINTTILYIRYSFFNYVIYPSSFLIIFANPRCLPPL